MAANAKGHTFFSRFRKILLFTSFLMMASCNEQLKADVPLPDDATQEVVTDESQNLPDQVTPDASPISSEERESILNNYDHVDPQQLVPNQALEKALIYFHQNKHRFTNTDYISVINFAQSSKEKRFYIINMKTGAVWGIRTAHGKGSDENRDGYAEKFSNTSGSNASSLGFYKTAETYIGKHGLSLRLDGLSTTNSNARARAVVIHGANYVQESSVIQGRSWGCPAIAMELRDTVIKYLKGGSLIYATLDSNGSRRP